MEEEDEKAVDEVEEEREVGNKLAGLAAIPRSGSHSVGRPPSRPAPSARVRALSKDDLEDVEQNSEEDDEEEEEEDDDDPAIQIEGFSPPFYKPVLHRYHFSRSMYLHERENHKRFRLSRERLSPPVLMKCMSPKSSESESLSLSDYSSDELYPDKEIDRVQTIRDQFYLNLRRAYDPADFEHLQVSSEVKELFQFITRYTPQNIDLDTKLRPFIPEFIPAVGDIDAFIKVPRPDGVLDKLGLVALDEPCAKQSDPTVLDLQLRAISKETTYKSVAVKTLENADKRPKEIDAWINSISNLHRSKPPPTVHYSRNMPDIETLMQEWPSDFEETLNQVGIPTADLDCTLEEYVEIICGIMDIPVHRSRIQSLHVLFSLFLEFRNSPHFRSLSMGNDMTNATVKDEADRLVIRE